MLADEVSRRIGALNSSVMPGRLDPEMTERYTHMRLERQGEYLNRLTSLVEVIEAVKSAPEHITCRGSASVQPFSVRHTPAFSRAFELIHAIDAEGNQMMNIE
jgi:hypothetical protein